MSNFRRKVNYDPTLTYGQEVDANGAAYSHILDANGDPYFTATNPANVQAVDLDIRDLDSTTDSVTVEATDLDIRALTPATDEVVVQATNLDIRALDSATDSVEVLQSVAADLNATVVATDLDIRSLDSTTDSVEVEATDLDIRDLDSATDSITVEATDLDIRDLVSTSDSVAVTTVKPDGTNTMPSLDAVARQGFVAAQFIDESGTAYGVKHVENKPRVSAMPYLYDIAEGNVPGHYPFLGRGFSPDIDTTLRTVWPYSSTQAIYVYPTAEMQMEFLSSDNTQDIGDVIKGDATGNTVQADADGTTTSLEDDSVDFTAATAVAVGDVVILDPHGTTPEFGTVTAVAANTLTVAGGFSAGGTAASRYYAVIDTSTHTGAQAIIIDYLDGDYVSHEEICVLNGTTVTTTVNTDLFRIQDMHVIAVGSGGAPVGNIALRNLADTPVYSYITAAFTTSRVGAFTVPAGQTVYLTQWMQGWATPNDSKVQIARFIMRANMLPGTDFHTGNLFYPWSELVITNAQTQIDYSCPLRFTEKTDIQIVGIASTGGSGPASALGRGWIE